MWIGAPERLSRPSAYACGHDSLGSFAKSASVALRARGHPDRVKDGLGADTVFG